MLYKIPDGEFNVFLDFCDRISLDLIQLWVRFGKTDMLKNCDINFSISYDNLNWKHKLDFDISSTPIVPLILNRRMRCVWKRIFRKDEHNKCLHYDAMHKI